MKKFLFAFLTIVLSTGYSWAPVEPGEIVLGTWRCGSCTGTRAFSSDEPECIDNFCEASCYSCGGTTITNQSVAITGGTKYWEHNCTTFSMPVYCVSGSQTTCDDGGIV